MLLWVTISMLALCTCLTVSFVEWVRAAEHDAPRQREAL